MTDADRQMLQHILYNQSLILSALESAGLLADSVKKPDETPLTPGSFRARCRASLMRKHGRSQHVE